MAAVLAGAAAQAQDASGPVEKVTVTGSRIKKPNLTSATQQVNINAQQIELSGEANTADVLRMLPSTGISALSTTNSNFLTSANGVNTVNLRNLGEQRTLVLVNGRRFVSGVAGVNIVDFNTIPTSMIERIDVVTSGASSIYGSDAVAGVINIVMKRDFEGVEANLQRGENTVFEENFTDQASLTVGGNFADDRGNAVLNVTYQDAGPAFARTRDPLDCAAVSTVAQLCPFFSSYAEGGRFRFSNSAGAASINRAVNPDGTIRVFNSVTDGFNRQEFRYHATPYEKYMFTGIANFDVTDRHRVFGEASYASTNSVSSLEPYPLDSASIYGPNASTNTEQVGAVLGQPFGVPVTNPYIPRQMLDLLGTQFGIVGPEALTREDLVNQLSAIPAAVIGFARRMTEFGGRGNDFESATSRIAIGAEGKIGSWDYQGSYVWGETTQSQIGGGQVNVLNMRQSLDAIDDGAGNIICRDPIARSQGCVAVNIFLPPHTVGSPTVGNWTEAAVRWLQAPVFLDQLVRQEVLEASVTGTIFELPAGPLEGAFGGEYRAEFSSSVPDALTQTGQNASNRTAPTIGGFDVYEAFAELRIPLLAHMPMFEDLAVTLSGREAQYSTVGANFSWSASSDWTVTPGMRFRGQVARTIRAPNIAELFAGPSETFAPVTDVCNNLDVVGAPPGTNNNALGSQDPVVIANCLANAGIAARANAPGGFVLSQPERQATGGFVFGNPDLKAETGDSYSFGLVLTPDLYRDWLGNFILSVDYFNFDITDAISAVSRNNYISLCYQTPGLANPLCAGLLRDINGALAQVNQTLGNSNHFLTDGVDVDATYAFDVASLMGSDQDYGRLTLGALYTHLFNYNVFSTPPLFPPQLALTEGLVGISVDRVQLSAVYAAGPLVVSWTGRWLSEADTGFGPPLVPASWFHDAQVRYEVTDNIVAYVGARNLMDEYVFVPGTGGDLTQPTGWTTFPDTYDGLGRRWYAGVKLKF